MLLDVLDLVYAVQLPRAAFHQCQVESILRIFFWIFRFFSNFSKYIYFFFDFFFSIFSKNGFEFFEKFEKCYYNKIILFIHKNINSKPGHFMCVFFNYGINCFISLPGLRNCVFEGLNSKPCQNHVKSCSNVGSGGQCATLGLCCNPSGNFKWHQNDIKMTSKWHQNDIKMTSKWHQNDIKMTFKNIYMT
jgi:hypothetical protein